MTPLDLHIEPAPKKPLHEFIGIGRQAGVRVQENQHIPPGLSRARVHLRGAAARRDHDSVAKAGGELRGAIIAAAVDDEHFVAAPAQRRERSQRIADTRRLVQRRDDDRKSFSDQS